MNKLIDQLKVHEGSRTHAYDCPAGYITIGVGRNIDPNGGLGLSEDEIRLPIKERHRAVLSRA
jgi:GH24 family phage-related lysozyme (muramidase)